MIKKVRAFIGGLIIGLAGYLLWRLAGYGRQLFRQPLLAPIVLPEEVADQPTTEARAMAIAIANVRAGIEQRLLHTGERKLVLCAGRRNFREPWARDLGFASFGLLDIEEYQTARESLEVFLCNQRLSGQFPVKVHSTNILDRYLHSLFKREQPVQAPLKPKYKTAHQTVSLDGNALLVIACLNYVDRTGDEAFIRRYWPALKKAVMWLEAYTEGRLLRQAAFADWADSVDRRGRTLYPNILYWKALQDMARAALLYDRAEDQPYFAAQAQQLKQAINNHFWRDDLGYYITNLAWPNLSSGGNLLAIAWGLTAPAQAHAILDKMDEFGMADPAPTKAAHPPYPNSQIALENRLAGIPNYHTSAAWLWLGAWHIIALQRMERAAEAETLLHRQARLIERDGVVHEVYHPDGSYLSSFWYSSEAPLTWSASMFIHACAACHPSG